MRFAYISRRLLMEEEHTVATGEGRISENRIHCWGIICYPLGCYQVINRALVTSGGTSLRIAHRIDRGTCVRFDDHGALELINVFIGGLASDDLLDKRALVAPIKGAAFLCAMVSRLFPGLLGGLLG